MNRKALLLLVVIPFLMGNEGGCDDHPSASRVEQSQNESNQDRLMRTLPAPRLATSLERKNLVRRLQRVNSENMSGFIYLIDHGVIMASYPVNGKITSLNAYLGGNSKPAWFGASIGWQMVESPDLDGAYGKNDDGIFFFTADSNAYVEWKGDYLFSDQPLKLSQQPAMLRIMPSK
jgi:hypothetical protein